MYLSLKGSLGHTPITDRVGEGPLQIAEGAAAAYSLRNLGSDSPSVVRVRRESDNNERDFTAQDISTSVLTNWVNEQITPPLDLRELTATGRDGPIIEAAAAYSLRNLSDSYTGSVVEVRRSSDGALRSFTAAEVTDGTLTDWVTEEQVGWNVQPTWDVSSGDGVISSQSSTATTSTFSITTTSGNSFVRQTSKPNHIIASFGDQVVANITLSGFDAAVSARLRFAGTNIDVAQQTLSNGTADYTFDLTGPGGYFAFVNLEATSGATLTFNSIKVIGKSGYVSKWYDQSTTSGVPNAKHAVQTDAAKQPKIVSGGSLVTGGLDFASDFLVASSVSGLTGSLSILSVSERDSSGNVVSLSSSSSFGRYFAIHELGATSNVTIRNPTTVNVSDNVSGSTRLTFALTTGATSTSVGANGSAVTTTSSDYGNDFSGTNINQIAIGLLRTVSPTGYFNGRIKEIIIYNTDQTDNRTALEANIGEVYGIAGIPAYDNTVNGFVETWYDQSGNGNNATQLTAAYQPKIVNAGALVQDGSNASLKFDGVNDYLVTTQGYIVEISQNPASVFAVANPDAIGEGYLLTEGDSVGTYSSSFILNGAASGSATAWINNTEFGSGFPASLTLGGFIYNGTNFQAYLNGAADGSSGTAPINAETSLQSYIATRADATTSFFAGNVSVFRLI